MIGDLSKYLTILLFGLFLIQLSGCVGSGTDFSLPSDSEEVKFPTWYVFDIETDSTKEANIAKNPDSILNLLKIFIGEKIGLGQLSPIERLYLQGFKLQVLANSDRMDSTMALLPDFLNQIIEFKDTSYLISVLGNDHIIGNLNYLTNEIEPYIDAAIRFIGKQPSSDEEAYIFLEKGILLGDNQKYESAQKVYLICHKYYLETANYYGLSLVNTNLGNLMAFVEGENGEGRYYRDALHYAKLSGREVMVLISLGNLGVFYRNNNLLDSAVICYRAILDHELVLNSKDKTNRYLPATFNLSNIYLDRGEYAKALRGYEEVLKVSKEKDLYIGLAHGNFGKGSVFKKQGNFKKAIEYYNKAISVCLAHDFDFLLLDFLKDKEIAYREDGNCEMAYETSLEIVALRDSFNNVDQKNAIHEIEMKYKSDLKDAENQKLAVELAASRQKLAGRNLLLIIISLSLAIFAYLLYTKHKLNRGLHNAYKVLMKDYKEKANKRKVPAVQAEEEEKNDEAVIFAKLEQYFAENEPFLNSSIRVNDIAEGIEVTPKEISSALKKYRYANFSNFVNEYRVERAKELLEDEATQHLTIAAIGAMAGFGNKQSFYSEFESITGVTPGYFRSNFIDQP